MKVQPRCALCGLCCRELILEADAKDAGREPRIRAECMKYKGDEVWLLNNQKKKLACHFLKYGRCSIHKTRPTMCRAFGPHDHRCVVNRGLRTDLPLEPAEEKPT